MGRIRWAGHRPLRAPLAHRVRERLNAGSGYRPSWRFQACTPRNDRATSCPAAGRARLRLGCGGDEVMAEANERGLCLDRAGCEQDVLALPRVGPLLAQRPARAL